MLTYDQRVSIYVRHAPTWAGMIPMVVGGAVLIGWVFGVREMQTGGLGSNTVKVNAAIAFILCGASLVALHSDLKLASTPRSTA